MFRGLLYQTGEGGAIVQKIAKKLFKNTKWSPSTGKTRKTTLSAQLTLVNVQKDKLVEKLEKKTTEWERERETMKAEWEREREMMNIELNRTQEALKFEKNRSAFWEPHYTRLNEDPDAVKSRNVFLEEEFAKIKTAKRGHDALEHGDITLSTNKVNEKKIRTSD